MPAFFVYLDPKASGRTLLDGVDAMIVHAADAPAAKALAVAVFPGNEYAWENSTAIAMPTSLPLIGWTLRVAIEGLGPVQVVGTPTDSTIDQLAALMVTALNATDEISAAAYNASTNVLTAAGVADELGDLIMSVSFTDDMGNDRSSLLGAITDEGAPEDALTVALPADAMVGVWKKIRQQ